jgi:hypothetical protein
LETPVAKALNATITVWPTHWVTVEPFVPELVEVLTRPVTRFRTGGLLGHTMTAGVDVPHAGRVRKPVQDGEGGYRLLDGAAIPLGRLPLVQAKLEELGYAGRLDDRRADSRRWVRDDGVFNTLSEPDREFVEVVQAEWAVGVVMTNDGQVVDAIAALAAAYPDARFAVGVVSREQHYRIERLLRNALDEPVGKYTVNRRVPGRVAVGLVHQLPKGNQGEWDVLVLPFAETMSEEAVQIALSGQYRRVVAFTRTAEVRDEGVRRRLEAITAGVWAVGVQRPPVSVVVLAAHGTRAAQTFTDPLDEKQELYWSNARRNRRIATVATRLMTRSKKSVRSVLTAASTEAVDAVTAAATAGVAVLTETPDHAQALAELLPGWAVWAAGDGCVVRPEPGYGIIVTELAAEETVLHAGVLVRATGTKWELPKMLWPNSQDVSSGVLIDFTDNYHPRAAVYAERRRQHYHAEGMSVLDLTKRKVRDHGRPTTAASPEG